MVLKETGGGWRCTRDSAEFDIDNHTKVGVGESFARVYSYLKRSKIAYRIGSGHV